MPTVDENKTNYISDTNKNYTERKHTNESENLGRELILKPCSNDFPRLVITSHIGDTSVVEREHVIDEKVTRKTEQYIDENTGETKLRTLEYIEKVIEKEVEITTEKIICLELRKESDDQDQNDESTNNNIEAQENINSQEISKSR